MTSLFNGIGTIVTGVLGAPVTVTPEGGLPREIEAAFREGPRMVQGADGMEYQTVLPTLTARRDEVEDIVPGGTLELPDARRYKVTGWMPSGSPASDALVELGLEKIDVHA